MRPARPRQLLLLHLYFLLQGISRVLRKHLYSTKISKQGARCLLRFETILLQRRRYRRLSLWSGGRDWGQDYWWTGSRETAASLAGRHLQKNLRLSILWGNIGQQHVGSHSSSLSWFYHKPQRFKGWSTLKIIMLLVWFAFTGAGASWCPWSDKLQWSQLGMEGCCGDGSTPKLQTPK